MVTFLRRLFGRSGHPDMSGASSLHASIRWVAEVLANAPEFSSRARAVAGEFGPAAIEALGKEFHTEQSPPSNLAHLFPGLGQWMAARQFAIFEILYHIGPPSLPLIRKVAFGEYDWTQGNAIEVLCRFAAEGIESDQIILELCEAIPSLRYEALVYAIRPLRTYAKTDPSLQRVIDELLSVPEFKEVFSEFA